jgi:hypothetical protein
LRGGGGVREVSLRPEVHVVSMRPGGGGVHVVSMRPGCINFLSDQGVRKFSETEGGGVT